MLGEALRIQCRRGDDEFEIGAARQQLFEIAEQEIDIERTLVRLVDDERVVVLQQRVAVYLGQQDTVGHQLDASVRADLVIEAHLVTDRATELGFKLMRNTRRHRARRDATRLRVSYAAQYTAPQCQTYLGQLRGLTRAGLTAYDDDLMCADGARQLLALTDDRQVCGELDSRQTF